MMITATTRLRLPLCYKRRSAAQGKVIAVVQPHRYTRLRDLFDQFAGCFNDADHVLVAPVYEAGETLIEGATHTDLVDAIRAHGHRHVAALDGPEVLAEQVAGISEEGDTVLCLGAGTITAWANALPEQLKARGA